jgi:hypothetical protein
MKDIEVRFLAMEYYFLILNRTYEVTIDKNGVHGAVVSQLMSSVNPKIASATESGNAYDLVPQSYVIKSRKFVAGGEEYLKQSRSNFSFNSDSVLSISYDPSNKWGMGPVPHTGKLYVTVKSNVTRELIVLGNPNITELLNGIELAGFPVKKST